MSINETEVAIEPDATDTPKVSLSDLTSVYTELKREASNATKELSNGLTMKDMDSISDIVSEGMKRIESFVLTNRQPSTTSKMLRAIGIKNTWAAKWLNTKTNEVKDEQFKERTIGEIADEIITKIDEQREQVIDFKLKVESIKGTLITSHSKYKKLLASAQELLTTASTEGREALDLKRLITNLTKSVIQIETTINNKITPLIGSATIAVEEIDAQLPDIEHDLKYESSLKTAQQSLANLIGMAKAVKEMTTAAGETIRDDIHKTTIESIQMIGDVMMDAERMKRIQKQDEAHAKNLRTVMDETQKKINQNYVEMNQIYIDHKKTRQETQHILLTSPEPKE